MGGIGHFSVSGERQTCQFFLVPLCDLPLLFDLSNDPDELSNVAGSPEHAAREASYAALITARYDLDALRRTIVDNQKTRRLSDQSPRQGQSPGACSLQFQLQALDKLPL